MKAPVKRIKPKYYYSPDWQSGSVARFDTPDDEAKWFENRIHQWAYTRYMPWYIGTLLSHYHNMREIPITKKILKGNFSEAESLWKKGKPLDLTT